MRSTAEHADGDDVTGRVGGRLRMTSEGMAWIGVAALLIGIGWYKSLNLVLVLGYGLAALMVVNGVLARRQVRRVSADRVPLPPVLADEDVRVAVLVWNTGNTPVTVGVSDPVIGPPAGWFLDQLLPGEIECHALRTFAVRGRFPAAPPTVWSGFPFGLLRYEAIPRARETDPLVVLPASGTADAEGLRRWVLRQAGGEGRARKVLRRVTADQADVRGVRPYRPGDNIRSVHWRSSARRRELLVREYDSAPSPALVVVVEPWEPEQPSDADRANLEAALSLAVTVVRCWAAAFGTRVTVAVSAANGVTTRSASGTEDAIREALVPLADVAGTSTPSVPSAGSFDRTLAGAARVLVTTRPDSPLVATLTRETGRPFVAIDPTTNPTWYQRPVKPAVVVSGLVPSPSTGEG